MNNKVISKITAKKLGRPTKYKPEFCEKLIEVMTKGGTVAMVCASFGVSRKTFYEWIDPKHIQYHAELSDSYSRGKELAQAWFEVALHDCCSAGDKGAIMFVLKNRFPNGVLCRKVRNFRHYLVNPYYA